jgi:hypothetical protein
VHKLRGLVTVHGTIGWRVSITGEQTHNFLSPATFDGSGEIFRNSLPARNVHRGKHSTLAIAYEKDLRPVSAQHDHAIGFAFVLFCACQFATPNRVYLLAPRDELVFPENFDKLVHVLAD